MPDTPCTVTSPRGHALAAHLATPDGPLRGTAVFAHCFTCSADLVVERRIVEALCDHGIAVLALDFTGLGGSEGEPLSSTFSADVEDLVAAAAQMPALLGGDAPPPSLLVGHSLGGAAALAAAPRIDSVAAVATIGAPSSPAHLRHLLAEGLDAIDAEGSAPVRIGGRTFTVSRSFVADLEAHALLDALPDLDRALLLLHSPRDEVVGIDEAAALYGAARHPKSFVSLDRADHLLTDPRDARYAAGVIAAWAERYLPDPPG